MFLSVCVFTIIYKLKTFALMFSEPCMHEKGASREMPHGSA
jgi:hypothetical protein